MKFVQLFPDFFLININSANCAIMQSPELENAHVGIA